MKVLELNHVCFSYTEEPLIEDLNLKLRSDEGCIVLYGRNGAGKSTLLNLICGLFPYGGEIVRDDFHIAYLPYDNPLMEDETVLANLQFFSRVFRQKNFSAADADTAWIMDALSIDFLQQRAGHPVHICVLPDAEGVSGNGDRRTTPLASCLHRRLHPLALVQQSGEVVIGHIADAHGPLLDSGVLVGIVVDAARSVGVVVLRQEGDSLSLGQSLIDVIVPPPAPQGRGVLVNGGDQVFFRLRHP